jgi:hypothetical protein
MASSPKCCSTLKSIYFKPISYELLVSHCPVAIFIIPEHVLDHVGHLIRILVQNGNQSVLDFLLLEQSIVVGIILPQDFHHPVPHKVSKPIVRKRKLFIYNCSDPPNPVVVSHFFFYFLK